MGENVAKAYSDDVVIVRVGVNYPPSAIDQITSVLRSRGVASVVIACEDVAVVRSTPPQATPKPIDPMEITHPDDVELLRREVRAWRSQQQAMETGASNAKWESVLLERDAARKAVDVSGALG